MLPQRDSRTVWTIGCAALALTVLLLLPAMAKAAGAVGEAGTLAPKEAEVRLKQARTFLRNKKATTEDLRSALEELAEAHKRFAGTDREVNTFRRKAETQLLKALALFRADRRSPHENKRGEVNARAAELLGDTSAVLSEKEARSLSLKIRAVIKDIADDRKPKAWQQEPLDAAYAALTRFKDLGTLEWMLKKHHHGNEREIPFLIAAHKAMVLFSDVPGRMKYEICDTFITAYSATELVAKRSGNSANDQAGKRFWDRMKVHVVPLIQHFAGKPKNAKGEALSTLREFTTWWRQHDDARKAPWK